jgi:hypothetical protein
LPEISDDRAHRHHGRARVAAQVAETREHLRRDAGAEEQPDRDAAALRAVERFRELAPFVIETGTISVFAAKRACNSRAAVAVSSRMPFSALAMRSPGDAAR